MWTVWVQFIRNFLCVLKALLPATHAWMQPLEGSLATALSTSIGAEGTPSLLEFLLCPTQLVVVFTCLYSGAQKIFKGVLYLKEAAERRRTLHAKMLLSPQPELLAITDHEGSLFISSGEDILAGLSDFVIGITFFVLACNSLHLRAATHPKPVVDSILLSEVAIAYYLLLMSKACYTSWGEARRLLALADTLQHHSAQQSLLLAAYEAGYAGALHRALGQMDASYNTSTAGVVEVEDECAAAASTLARLSSADAQCALEHRLRQLAKFYGWQLLIDLTFLSLNFIAWYGYMVAALAYYLPEDYAPAWTASKLYLTNADTDWLGNFAGDFAWTLEPLVILFVAPRIASMHVDASADAKPSRTNAKKTSSKKNKAD